MKALNRRKLITASAVLAIVGLAATAIPAQAKEVGVSSTEIKLGMTLPMTGTASLGYNKIPGAAKAYLITSMQMVESTDVRSPWLLRMIVTFQLKQLQRPMS